MWILASQSTAYVVGAVSWIFAERAGFLAYGRYMLRFARDNRHQTKSLGDKDVRERVEPFLTGETFYVYFHLLYEIEGDLRILLALILNVDRARHADRRLAAGRLRAGVRGAVPDAMADAQAGGQRLPGKPAHDQPDDRAGLHRLGQRLHRQPLQPAALARPASRPSCATDSTRRSGRS